MRNNIFFTLFFFFILGTFLYYFSRKKPLEKLKTDVGNIFGFSKSKTGADNEASDDDPARKKYPDNIAIDNKKETEPSQKKDKDFSFEDVISKGKEILVGEEKNEGTPIEQTKDLELFLPKSKKGEVVKHTAFILNYREEYEQADWVLHKVSPKAQFGKSKRNDNFRPDFDVSSGSAEAHDYSRSGYDRGHLCPAGDFKYDPQLQDETFLMSNMSPQDGELNRKIWNDLEGVVRRWAVRRKGLIVITGPVLKPGLNFIGFKNKIAVPEQFYKIIYDQNNQKMIAFLFKNEGSFDLIRNFMVTVDEVEQLTGINFFYKLSAEKQKQLESQLEIDEWF